MSDDRFYGGIVALLVLFFVAVFVIEVVLR